MSDGESAVSPIHKIYATLLSAFKMRIARYALPRQS
jgi:hypothetical protein